MTLTVPTLSRRRSKSLEPGSWLLTAMLDIINIRRNACEQGSGWTNWSEDLNGWSWSLTSIQSKASGSSHKIWWVDMNIEYHKSFDTLIAVDLNKQLLEAMTGRLCDGSLPSRIGGRGVVQAGGGVIMVISFFFHPLCLLPLQRRSFTFSAQWMSSLRVLCDPRGKTLITPNCFNLISRQRANKKSKYGDKRKPLSRRRRARQRNWRFMVSTYKNTI